MSETRWWTESTRQSRLTAIGAAALVIALLVTGGVVWTSPQARESVASAVLQTGLTGEVHQLRSDRSELTAEVAALRAELTEQQERSAELSAELEEAAQALEQTEEELDASRMSHDTILSENERLVTVSEALARSAARRPLGRERRVG